MTTNRRPDIHRPPPCGWVKWFRLVAPETAARRRSEIISPVLHKERRHRGLNLYDAARRFKIETELLTRWENPGHPAIPKPDTARGILMIYQTDMRTIRRVVAIYDAYDAAHQQDTP